MDEQVTPEQKMEVIRRRANMGASSAGIGAESANSMNPPNAIAGEGGTQMMTNPPAMSGGAAGNPSDGAVAGMKQQKGESQTLMDAMIWRMKKLTDRGE